MFDVCIEPEQTTYHDVLPEEILEEIVNEVIITNTYSQHVNIMGHWELTGNKIVAGNYVTPLLPKGDVTILPGGKLDMTARSVAMLKDGFFARYGSELFVRTEPDMYLECNTPDPENNIIDKAILINEKLKAGFITSVFPNPARDRAELRISCAFNSAVTANIYNMMSELVYCNYFPAGTNPVLELENLQSGTYVVQVSNGNSMATCKLVKL
jgi:hypothetical protein